LTLAISGNIPPEIIMQPTLTLYGTPASGHTHRVEALLALLRLPYVYVEAPASVRSTEAFRKLNPLGQIPVLVDDGQVFCDSGAIMIYLAQKYAPESGWLPDEPAEAAQVYRWLFIAAGELRHGPAQARGIVQWNWAGERIIGDRPQLNFGINRGQSSIILSSPLSYPLLKIRPIRPELR
jgi:glutathione S-transferase